MNPGPDRLRRLGPWATALVLAGLSGWLLRGGALNYDAQWAVVWGVALGDGGRPEIDLVGAPTSHPLLTVYAAAASLFVDYDAADAVRVLAHLALGAAVVLAYTAGSLLAGRLAGLASAVLLCISAPILINTAAAFQDVLTAALVLGALVLEIRRPRRGAAPLLLLGCAGLLRPEAWGIAVTYGMWCCWRAPARRRAGLVLLVALGPCLWLLSDLAWSGDALLSLHRTQAGAEVAERVTGLGNAPGQLETNLRATLRLPGLAAAAAGVSLLLVAWVASARGRFGFARPHRGWATVLALVGLLVAAFLTLAFAELPLLTRYVIPLTAVLVIPAGYALGGWTMASDWARRAWALGALVLALGVASVAGSNIDQVRASLTSMRAKQDMIERMGWLREQPALQRCPTTAVASYRLVAVLAEVLDRPLSSLPIREDPRVLSEGTSWVTPASPGAFVAFGLAFQERLPRIPPDVRLEGRTADIAVYSRGC